MGSPVPKGMSAVYMRILEAKKLRWKTLANEHNVSMTEYFLKLLDRQKTKGEKK